MTRCFIGLGGNLGDVQTTFRRAVALLDESVADAISLAVPIETPPVGRNAGQAFLNSVADMTTDCEPSELLHELQRIEAELGRERTGRWEPRSIDLDLLLFGGQVVDEPDLQVPHPAMWYRRFVLDPLYSIAPDIVHPERQLSIAALRQRLLARPLSIAIAGDSTTQHRIAETLAPEFTRIRFCRWPEDYSERQTRDTPTIVVSFGNGPCAWDELPEVARLDGSCCTGDRTEFVREIASSVLL